MSHCDSQSLSVSINEGLEEWFVMGDGLQDVPVSRHVADCPLAQASAAQPEDVAEREREKAEGTSWHCMLDTAGNLTLDSFPLLVLGLILKLHLTCQVCG